MRTETPNATDTRRRFGWSPVILVGGVLVAPFLLTLAFNSYGPPDDMAYVRMAFASVAGHTIAIIACLATLVYAYRHPGGRTAFTITTIVCGFLIMQSTGGMSSASELLLQRLG